MQNDNNVPSANIEKSSAKVAKTSSSLSKKPDSVANSSREMMPIASKKIRMELIFSQAIEEDFKNEFEERGIGKKFTKFEAVMGAGYSNPCLGDAIWPQLNMMYVIYCDKQEAKKIHSVVLALRKKYITEGIACFMSQAVEM